MKTPRIDIASIRREQIVDAAVAVIAEQGLQHLSLSEIEKKVGMSRGQLTYYYRAKEEILLAVFDRLLLLMCRQHEKGEAEERGRFLEMFQQILQVVLQSPPANPAFHALQYTFLSQISHREDFRRKLADLYEEWRRRMAEDMVRDGLDGGRFSPRALASLVQALLHGLAMQSAADPEAFDATEMAELCLDMLSTYLYRGATRAKSAPSQGERPVAARGNR